MKLRYLFLNLGILLFLCNSSSAQLVADVNFLQGRWLEVAIAPNGSWGSTVNAPAGYHTHTGAGGTYVDPLLGTIATGNRMDFSYDANHDGWTVGNPTVGTCFGEIDTAFYGAYFLPGTPFDGWAIQMNGVRSDAYYTSAGFALGAGATSFTGTNTAYQLSLGNPCGPYPTTCAAGIWNGSYSAGGGTLAIRSVNRVDTLADWLRVNIYFKNTGATTITGLHYLVTGDPDNDQPSCGGSFPTDNHISYQNDALHRVEVNGLPPTIHQDAFSGLATRDCRAKAIIYQSWPSAITVPLSAMHAGSPVGTYTPSAGAAWYTQKLDTTTFNQDIAYGLVYNLGSLAPGDSTSIAFAWIFHDTADIDRAFQAPKLNANCTVAPTNSYTMSPCGLTNIPVAIINGEWGTTNWKWSPATALTTTAGVSNSIDVSLLTGPITYTITPTDTQSCIQQPTFYLTLTSCVDAVNNSPICRGDTLILNSPGDSLGFSYVWRGPGFSGPIRGFAQQIKVTGLTPADNGLYYVTKTMGASSDTASTPVIIKPLPTIVATSNAPICSGNTLNLISNPDVAGETWAWTGPGGFTSTLSDPTRPTAPTNYSGTYWVRATLNGCIDSAFVNVVVDSTPEVPLATNSSPICSGLNFNLFGSDATAGVTYRWDGPGGYTSTLPNPTVTSAATTASGVYTLTVRLGLCTNSNTTTVTVNPTPSNPILGSNSPVCSGSSLNLTATGTAGATYSWTGPNGFTSLLTNPVINPAYTPATGMYSVIATLGPCSSGVSTIFATVDSTPIAPTASSNSPGAPGLSICEDDTLLLFASHPTPGVTYSWAGPGGFTSTLQNPIIYHITMANAGIYTVTATFGACTSTALVTVVLTPMPTLTITSNSPVCAGDSLLLTATTVAGATFTWAGPYSFISTSPSPFRNPSVPEHSGVYTVTALVGTCTIVATHAAIVHPVPDPPLVPWPVWCQYYDVQPLRAFGSNILWYPSAAAGAVGDPTAPTPSSLFKGVQWFYVSQTVNNCTSVIDSIKVTINPKPNVKAVSPFKVCPRDTVLLTASTDSANVTKFEWSPSLYLPQTVGASVTAHPETDVKYMVVATNIFGCTDSEYVNITVHPNAVIYVGDSVTIFPGESYQINPQTNGTSFVWSPTAGLDNPNISNPIARPDANTRYVVKTISEQGCMATDTLNIYVSTESLLTLPNAFTPGSGANNTFKVIKRGLAVLNHFRIYNRWGEVVFETNDIDAGWDGTYKGVPQPFGVYVYEVSAVTNTGKQFIKTGNVTLIR